MLQIKKQRWLLFYLAIVHSAFSAFISYYLLRSPNFLFCGRLIQIFLGGEMVVLINAESPFFDQEAARQLFEINREAIEDRRGFADYLTRWFFNIYENGSFVGCIFCYHEDNKDWVGGFARRKTHASCLEALNRVKSCFPELYASTRQLSAKIILRKAGFVRTAEPGIYVWNNILQGENK